MQVVMLPNYSYVFQFEDEFDHIEAKDWFTRYWTICFYYVGVYMLVIFTGQQLMANRPRYELRGALIVWNLLLAAFSIIGTCRTIPEFVHVLREYGLYYSVCVPRFVHFLSTWTQVSVCCNSFIGLFFFFFFNWDL